LATNRIAEFAMNRWNGTPLKKHGIVQQTTKLQKVKCVKQFLKYPMSNLEDFSLSEKNKLLDAVISFWLTQRGKRGVGLTLESKFVVK